MRPIITKHDSGLTEIRVPMPGVASVTVLALVNVGSRYEQPNQHGLAHFLEHMVFKGTKKYPSAQKLAMAVDAVGAEYNAYTSKEYTGFYVHLAAEHAKLGVEVVTDMLLAPLLPAAEMEKEKGVIVEEIHMYLDTPMRHIGDAFEEMFYRGSGLSHPIIGDEASVTGYTKADFDAFISQWYDLSNMVLIVAGQESLVASAPLIKAVEKSLAKLKPGSRKAQPDRTVWLSSDAISQEKLRLISKETEQAHFIIGFPGISRHDAHKYPLAVLSTILGSSMSSRLFSEVREKRGLCYYIHSDVDHYHDTGSFGASAGIDPKRIHEALDVTLAEFFELADGKKPITPDELQRAKDYITGKMVLGLEDSQSVAQFFGMKQLLLGEIESPEAVMQKFKAVSLDEVTQLAKELIAADKVRLALIGPYQNESEFNRYVLG